MSDSIVHRPEGKWFFTADSFVMQQLAPQETTYTYAYKIEDGLAEFKCVLDWDRDGEKDDVYVGVQRKQMSSDAQ